MKVKFYSLCFFVSVAFMIALSSCAIHQSEPITPPQVSTVDVESLVENAQLLDLSAPAGWNSFKTVDPIVLMILNVSEKEIISTENFRSRIFIQDERGWIEIKNKATYSDTTLILRPFQNDDPSTIDALFLLPDLPDTSKFYTVRILVSGAIEENDQSEETVVDYIDVQMVP